MKYRPPTPFELAESSWHDVNLMAGWYSDLMFRRDPLTSYCMLGLTFYGIGYLGGSWIGPVRISGKIGGRIGMKVFLDLQANLFLTAYRNRAALSRATGVASFVVGTGVVASELQSTLHGNLGMQEIPGSMGGYSHPMGGGDSSYYPFQSFFDMFSREQITGGGGGGF